MAKKTNRIVKRKGHTEDFDEKKLYASIFAACKVTRSSDEEAELIAGKVMEYVNQWLAGKHEVTAHDIYLQTIKHFKPMNDDAAYLYQHHHVLS